MSKKIKRKKRSFLNRFIKGTLDFGIFLLLVLLLTFILSKYVVERIVIQNHSMETTIYPNDSILIDKISYKFSEPKRYDIVVFKQKGTSNELIKRIIGLPHETIQIIDKDIYINGEKIEDVKNLDSIDFAGNASVPITHCRKVNILFLEITEKTV